MSTLSKSNIAAILPLTEMQEALLLHHLAGEEDEGSILVEFQINGPLEPETFKIAWDMLIRQYDVLRSTVHWEKLKNPMQVVHHELAPTWQQEDLSHLDTAAQIQRIAALKSSIKNTPADLGGNPLLQFHLLKTGDTSHHFLWPCHHILLDGWSTSIIIQQLMEIYDELKISENSTRARAVPSLRAYIRWKNDRDKIATEAFWKSYLSNLKDYPLFTSSPTAAQRAVEVRKQFVLEAGETKRLAAYAGDLRISLNSLVQSLWGLLVIAYGRTGDVVVGATVSGRSNDFPKIEKLPGMFSRVQPVRFKVTPKCVLSEWLQSNQKNLLGVLEHEHTALKDIDAYCDWQLPSPLFDSIVIFENHPWSDLRGKTLSFDGFKGGLTSTYPVSLIVIPGTQLTFNFSFKEAMISEETMDWILRSWEELITHILNSDIELADVLVSKLSDRPKPLEIPDADIHVRKTEIISPANELESRLLSIWKRVLPEQEISTNANFFEIGGSSLMAIRMFAILEKELGMKESPTKLLLYPSIQELAGQLGEEQASWEYVIPLRETGQKTPVFCIHGGEGHVLFYQLLPKYLDPERPVYLVQPKGIDGEGPMHSSIQEMSADYLQEIQKVQANGPYNIVFFCYSALAIEFAKILKEQGEEVNLIITDSTAKEYKAKPKNRINNRFSSYVKRLSRYPFQTLKFSLVYRYRRLIEPFIFRLTGNKEAALLRKVRVQLQRIHADYEWNRFQSDCALILLQNEHPKLKEKKIDLWNHWCRGKVNVHYTPGNHLSIFEEPHVQSLGQIIESACN